MFDTLKSLKNVREYYEEGEENTHDKKNIHKDFVDCRWFGLVIFNYFMRLKNELKSGSTISSE